MKKFTLLMLVLLLSAYPLYSRPKLELSMFNIHPMFPEWYKRYDLSLTVNPSSCFGLRFVLGELDFVFKDFSINSTRYGGVEGLLYFSNDNVSLYALLRLGVSYDGVSGYYEEYSSFYFSSTLGFGVDWYFWERAACFFEVQDLLWFRCSRSYGETSFHLDGNPGVVFGLKFGIY